MDEKINKIRCLLKDAERSRYSNPQNALALAKKALELSKKQNNKLGIALSSYKIADSYANLGEYEKALMLTFNSLNFFIEEGFYDLQWWGFNCLGTIFLSLGDYDRSMHFYNKCETTIKDSKNNKKYDSNFSDEKALVITLNNISENYKLLYDYKTAIDYCSKSYTIDKKSNFIMSKGVSILSLGEIYYLIKNYDKAYALALYAVKYTRKYNYTLALADAYKLLALTNWKKNDLKKAEKYFEVSIKMNKSQSVYYYEIDTYIKYHEYLDAIGKTDDAIKSLNYALKLSLNHYMLDNISKISGLLGSLYEKINNREKAFHYYKMHFSYEKSFSHSFNKQLLNNFNIKNQLLKLEEEKNKITANENELKMKSISLQNLVDKISIISELGQKITATTDIDSIIDILNSSIKNFMNLNYFALGLYNKKNKIINYLSYIQDGKKSKAHSVPMNETDSFSVKCIKSKEAIVINDLSSEYKKYIDKQIYNNIIEELDYKLDSILFYPLIIDSEVIGILTIQSKEKNAFDSYQIEMIKSLSSYAAIAVNNALKSIELKNLNKELLFLSENDSMTGIPNRRKLNSYLNSLWKISIKENLPISIILIDIDYFKQYNDNYGHIEGDNCIISVAKSLNSITAKKYFVSRYGGDEFIIVLKNTDKNAAVTFAKSVDKKISDLNIEHKFSKTSNKVTLSMGIYSNIPNQSTTIKNFIKNADKALYKIKHCRFKK
ncbi:MAG: diguanylate cyclase [Clostridium sp.]|nr:diguanylate cyclase [Clostridium sp.]